MAEIVWTSGAVADLQGIFDVLEERRPGAGVDFVTDTDARLELLKLFPRMNAFYLPPFRRLRLPGSRGLFYVIENRGIVVHAIADLRQNPATLHRRLSGDR